MSLPGPEPLRVGGWSGSPIQSVAASPGAGECPGRGGWDQGSPGDSWHLGCIWLSGQRGGPVPGLGQVGGSGCCPIRCLLSSGRFLLSVCLTPLTQAGLWPREPVPPSSSRLPPRPTSCLMAPGRPALVPADGPWARFLLGLGPPASLIARSTRMRAAHSHTLTGTCAQTLRRAYTRTHSHTHDNTHTHALS